VGDHRYQQRPALKSGDHVAAAPLSACRDYGRRASMISRKLMSTPTCSRNMDWMVHVVTSFPSAAQLCDGRGDQRTVRLDRGNGITHCSLMIDVAASTQAKFVWLLVGCTQCIECCGSPTPATVPAITHSPGRPANPPSTLPSPGGGPSSRRRTPPRRRLGRHSRRRRVASAKNPHPPVGPGNRP
jgi:hypothetical protein